MGGVLSSGRTRLPDPVPEDASANVDMSLASMADDLVRLLKTIYPERSEAPAVVLVGHSMVSASSFSQSQTAPSPSTYCR